MLQIARLAWNLGKWIAQIALPSEVVRWEWKRFRRHFVYIAAKVLKKGHRLVVRLAGSHRFLPMTSKTTKWSRVANGGYA